MSRKKRYPVRHPRYAAGIRAQDTRFTWSQSWWVRRWGESLEKMNLLGRLGRAKHYAANGQVTDIALNGPQVVAMVTGMRSDPYRVTIDFRTPDGESRNRIVGAIRHEPMLVARLLANELPLEVAEIFSRNGYDLFPGGKLGPGRYDVTTACSCPDYANPCKHADAVMILLGEEIARRPLTLLELRGIRTEDLL